jgi:diguanylate cyclase (GGDEF)-like protein
MKTAKIRFGVFAQLALLMGGLAAVSTGVALIIQDRTLSADLRQAASDRLTRAAEAAERLLRDHLQGVAQRYASISATPEFRANLEAGDGATLAYNAESLVERTGAAIIAFESPERSLVAAAGDQSLQPIASEALGANDVTYLTQGGRLYAVTAVPLRIGGELIGHLLAAETVGPEMLDAWSSVLGVRVSVVPPEPRPSGTLTASVPLTGATLEVSTTYEAEQLAIARARRNLVLAGVAAMALAVLAGALLAHSFSRPIRQMKRAVERVGGETVDGEQLDVHRPDELGDLGRAFSDMLSRLRESEVRLARAQRLARFSNWWFDPVTDEIEAGPDFRRLFELEDRAQLQVGDLLRCVHPEDRDKLAAAVERVRSPRGAFRADVRVPVRKGRDRVLHLRAQHRGADGQPARVEASAQDVTERWNSARQIEFLSLHDSVTGLGNRRYLFERLSLQLKEAELNESMVVLLLVGIDGFANIEGAMGHQVGDELLCEVARRLVATLAVPRQPDRRRKRDPSSYSVVRFGNDEFASVDTVVDRADAATLAKTVANALEEPYVIDGHEIAVSVSIGISVYPDDAKTVDALVRYGTTALQTGRTISDAYHFYDESIHQREVRRLRVAALLRRAIEREELELHYQPRVRPESGKIVAVEALARWTHEELGPISPGEFVPIAEDVGLIQSLGDWCLRAAVRDLLMWRSIGLTDLRVSVNLSAQEILPGLLERVLDITHPLDPSRIEFEVTESAVLRNPDEALCLLTQLSDHGFRIALDDFGTGYSSLSHVRQLPLDAVKVDRSFIQDLGTNAESLSITGAVIMMCQAMELESVGEGVETEQQRRRLVELGCDEAQGHLFAPAMPPADLATLLKSQGVASVRPQRRRRRAKTRR